MSSTSRVFYKWGAGVRPDLPRIDRAYDEFLVTTDGTEIIDAAAGAAVVNLGHSVDGVADVVQAQLDDVSYLSLSHFTEDAPERLAERLAAITPGDLDYAFLANSGSEANETAFKLARAFHHAGGDTGKSTIIGRWQSYHGATLGALSATGNTARRAPYEPMLNGWAHVPPAYPFRWKYGGTPAEQAVAAARELETTIRQEGAETVAAFVAEPVGGASIPAARPHPAYYREIRRICDEYDVLFIADEVMTGFGRTGPMFAMEHYDVLPDMLVVGKGLSNGYTPISGVMLRDRVVERFEDGEASFNHGHTLGGNPLSAAIAAHVVEQYSDDVLAIGRARGELLADELAPLRDHPLVGDFRQVGAMVGIEIVADRATNEPFDPDLEVAQRIYDEAFDRGVYTYPGGGSVDGVAGDHLMLTPPLTISESSVQTVASAVLDAVDAVHREIGDRVVAD